MDEVEAGDDEPIEDDVPAGGDGPTAVGEPEPAVGAPDRPRAVLVPRPDRPGRSSGGGVRRRAAQAALLAVVAAVAVALVLGAFGRGDQDEDLGPLVDRRVDGMAPPEPAGVDPVAPGQCLDGDLDATSWRRVDCAEPHGVVLQARGLAADPCPGLRLTWDPEQEEFRPHEARSDGLWWCAQAASGP